MKRLFIVAEGETEERFIRRVLYPHFIQKGIHLEPQQWITNRKLGVTGGGNNFDIIENHLRRLMNKYQFDNDVFISVMIDLYAFPKQGNTVYDEDVKQLYGGIEKVGLLEKKMKDRFSYRNFVPYVQLHEYETLLLSRPEALEIYYPDKTNEIKALKVEINGIPPEEINETPQGAPSKRICKYIPKYEKQKTSAGVMAVEDIGLHYLREMCVHFNNWITRLENI